MGRLRRPGSRRARGRSSTSESPVPWEACLARDIRILFELGPLPMLVCTADGRVFDANRSCRTFLGLRDLARRRYMLGTLVDPRDAATLDGALARLAVSGPQMEQLELRWHRPSTTLAWARTIFYPILADGGTHQGYVVSLEDTTPAHHLAERQRESDGLLHQVMERVHDGFWLVTADLTEIVYMNPAVPKLWGVDPDEVIRAPMSVAALVDPDDRARVMAEALPMRSTPVELEFRIHPPQDREVRWLRVRLFPVADEQGRIGHIAGIIEDVTDRHRTARLLDRARKHAVRLVQAIEAPLEELSAVLQGTHPIGDGAALDVRTRLASLTRRERQVLEHLLEGKTTRAVAATLDLSPKTVEGYRANVMRKMAAASLVELVRTVVDAHRASP